MRLAVTLKADAKGVTHREPSQEEPQQPFLEAEPALQDGGMAAAVYQHEQTPEAQAGAYEARLLAAVAAAEAELVAAHEQTVVATAAESAAAVSALNEEGAAAAEAQAARHAAI